MTTNQLKAREIELEDRRGKADLAIKHKDANTRRAKANSDIRRAKYQNTKDLMGVVGDSAKLGKDIATTIAAFNDPKWYKVNETVARDVASLPFGRPIGDKIDFGISSPGSFTEAIPGLMAIRVAHGPGISNKTNTAEPFAANAAQTAAQKVYSFVRHANSGHSNYEPSDILIYLLALDEINILLTNATRAYGLMHMYSPLSRYAPRAYVEASGFDFDDLMQNSAKFRAGINLTMEKMARFAMPGDISYLNRHASMFAGVFHDGSSKFKSQHYMFVPAGFRKYTTIETGGNAGAGRLHWTTIPSTEKLTVDGFLRRLTDVVDALYDDEDIGIISGDILKAYGADSLLKYSTISEDYYVEPVYSEDYLLQIHNATLIGDPLIGNDGDAMDIVQSKVDNTIQYRPTFNMVINPADNKTGIIPDYTHKLISIDADQPTVDQVLEATRLMVIPKSAQGVTSETEPYFYYYCESAGSEIACSANIYTYFNDNGEWVLGRANIDGDLNINNTVNVTNWAASFTSMARVSRFNYAPQFNVMLFSQSESIPSQIIRDYSYVWNIHNYYPIDESTLAPIHSMAILKQLSIPTGNWAN